MRTPYHGVLQPFTLRSNVVFFHDWRYVYPGGQAWLTPEGVRMPLFTLDPVPPLRFGANDTPLGIRLRAMPAKKVGPFLSPERPWEGVIGAPTVIREQGRYRLWYEAVSPRAIGQGNAGENNHLCYAESDDGMSWARPDAGVIGYGDLADSNIVYGGDLSPEWGYHGGSVFADPVAPPEERYKAWHLAIISPGRLAAYQAARPDEADPMSLRSRKTWAMCGATSPDGLHWTPLAEPCVVQTSDTQNICYYDDLLRRYVAYFRTWVLGRRSIGRSETDDFRRFPLPETILWPDASVGPADLWYANGKTVYPAAADYHLLFPKRWDMVEDRFHAHVMTGPDGILWGFPPHSEVLSPGEYGAWDAGGVSIGCGLVDLSGDRVGAPFVGYRIPHKHSRRPPLGEFAWAAWTRGRLVALEAPERGEFRTWNLVFQGNQLRLNCRTRHAGWVRVEAVGADGPIPGRTFDDCDPVTGDHLDRLVTWKGESAIPRQPDQPVAFRVRLAAAELYAMGFE